MESTQISGTPLVPGAAKGRYCSCAETASSTRRRTLILLIDDLDISALKELRPKLKGMLVTKRGLLSHTAIFARELSIPLLLIDAPPALPDGALVCFGEPGEARPLPSQITTADGLLIRFSASVWSMGGLQQALAAGLPIGLLRTEALTPHRSNAVYTAAMKASDTIIRLYDFEGDKAGLLRGDEAALRAAQLASLVALPTQTLGILLPNVSHPNQLHTLRDQLCSMLRGSLPPRLGAMLETREAFLLLPEILSYCDFAHIGLNALLRSELPLRTLLDMVQPLYARPAGRASPSRCAASRRSTCCPSLWPPAFVAFALPPPPCRRSPPPWRICGCGKPFQQPDKMHCGVTRKSCVLITRWISLL